MRRVINIIFITLILSLIYNTGGKTNTINNINTKKSNNKIEIELVFSEKPINFKIDNKNNILKIIISECQFKNIIPSLPSEIEQIDFQRERENLIIKFKMKEKIRKFTYYTKNNTLKIEVWPSNNNKKERKIFPYQLPPSPQEITLPFENNNYSNKTISLDLQDADIRTVIRLLSEIGNVNIVLGEEIKGKVTLKLKNVPWDQVLDIIMARFGLGKVKINDIIYIAPLNKLQKQAEELHRLKRTLAEEKEIGPLETQFLTVNYVNACELVSTDKKEMSIKSLLSEKGVVSCDARTNILIVKDTKENIKKIKKLLSILDTPTKQVLIEARIVEASTNFAKNLGIQWYGGYYKTNRKTNFRIGTSNDLPYGKAGRPDINRGILNSATSPFGPIVDLGVPYTSKLGFAIGYITKTSALLLDLHLSAMEQQGQGKIISSPRIITRDNGEAIIRQGYKIPYLELTDQGTATTKFIDADLTLKVIPHILPNNEIRLEINIDKSEPDWAKQVNGVPAILTRSAQTFVRIPNDGTVVIGGLKISKKQEAYGKVPGLSKIPAVGSLFKNSQKTQEEQELLIFITSKVISTAVEEIDY